MASTGTNSHKGGEFLLKETPCSSIFIVEEFTEEQQMIAQTCHDFIRTEVTPRLEEIDNATSTTVMASLIDKAGELGLVGIAVPEEYGGFGMDFNTSMLAAECTGAGHSFSVAFSAHTGIGTLPIVYYGNEEQKQRYLPKLASGEWKSAYCLTEPESGSDANSARTRAKLTPDGRHYQITGQKMWITNGGFADILIVFAKIEEADGKVDKNLTAFIVERNTEGITMNPPEKKMGIKGSDTRQIFFNDCLVPIENQLSSRENGFKIAVNILNVGRIKLAAATLGGAKQTFTQTIQYAIERKQFGVAISSFGAIQHKLAKMAIKIFATESASYRAGHAIEEAITLLKASGLDGSQAKLKALEEFAIECAILKVYGSESLDYIVDEGVQVFGGMGFSAEGPLDRAYRDSRINRIFEGTNEINRLLIVDMLVKRAMKGQLNIMEPALAVGKELMSIPSFGQEEEDDTVFAKEKRVLQSLKKSILLVAGAAVQKFMMSFAKEQEIIMHIADMIIEVYTVESSLLRAEKLVHLRGEQAAAIPVMMAKVHLYESVDKVQSAAREAITSFAEADELKVMLVGLKRFTKIDPINLKDMRRAIAAHFIENRKYIL